MDERPATRSKFNDLVVWLVLGGGLLLLLSWLTHFPWGWF